jgi:cell division protein FtsN
MARVLFDKNSAPQACARLGDAARTAPSGDVELRNQIDYLNQRCVGVDTTAVAAAPAAAKTPADKGKAPAAKGKAPAETAKAPAAHAASKTSPAHEPARAETRKAEARTAAAAHAGRFTIQVAAYSTRSAAEVLSESLHQRGYDARVVGTTKPFRVRVGFYVTRAEADAEVQRMRARHMTAFVTEAEPR